MNNLSRAAAVQNFAQITLISLFIWTFLACGSQSNEYVEPPPPKVTVAKPLQQAVTDYLEFTGTTHAFEEVEVRARVAGFLQSMNFTPGTKVEKGELLFVIDPREYQAELNAANAELRSAEAQLKRAEIEFKRAEKLFKQKAGAETDVVKWRGERDVAGAAVLRAKAKVEKANLNLSYTQVTAPITGRVGRNLVDLGNLVGEREPTLLTKVTRYDPMYAYFNLNERDLLKAMAMNRNKIQEKDIDPAKEPVSEADIPVFLELANEEGYPHQGELDFAESGVDKETGTLQLRGVFPNPGPAPVLLPGLFVSLRMPVDKRDNALLVTERAIGSDQGGRFLLAVNSENMVEKRPIRMGQLVDGLRVIEEGLQPDDSVVVNGLQRARPGAKVDPEQTDMKSLTASAFRAAAEAGKDKAKPAATPSQGDNAQADKEAEKGS
ncbi:MAG: efflux RND transporter periplasmic adaptor subunit [Desulfobacterales bacterium]|jgi:RND family efflux transporter MFP subunit